MPIEELSALPARFHAGDTVKVRTSHADYPAASWVLTVSFSGPQQFKKVAAVDSDEWLLTLTPTDTEKVKPGLYAWAMRATSGTEAVTFRSGKVQILPNLEVVAEKTPAAKLVENLEAALVKLSTKTAQSVSVNGKSYSILNIGDLQTALRFAKAALAEEQAKATGQNNRRVINLRFTRP